MPCRNCWQSDWQILLTGYVTETVEWMPGRKCWLDALQKMLTRCLAETFDWVLDRKCWLDAWQKIWTWILIKIIEFMPWRNEWQIESNKYVQVAIVIESLNGCKSINSEGNWTCQRSLTHCSVIHVYTNFPWR